MKIGSVQSVLRLATQTFFKMFKLVVLFALVAGAVAKPGVIHGHSAVAARAVAAYAVPSAVSHSYRSDIVVNKPVVETYAAPAIVATPVAVPAAVSHTYRSDVISKPVVTAVAAPALVTAPVVQKIVAPIVAPAAVSQTYRSDVISKPVVAAYGVVPVVAKTVVATPAISYSAHAPIAHAW
ncbi:hypothetical protein NQ314_019400 [Rhamnusium bicolor]|uniref:Uncharacterized protein n=1 Tax=Rhamnusium bicolor TaxID=1586634 RepID=A0AAV8WNH6_9CUCU|nr:hypothetical protein NQ314_019400 [Rhamnusium bicolor]